MRCPEENYCMCGWEYWLQIRLILRVLRLLKSLVDVQQVYADDYGDTHILHDNSAKRMCHEDDWAIWLCMLTPEACGTNSNTYISRAFGSKIIQEVCRLLVDAATMDRLKKMDRVRVITVRENSSILDRKG